MTPTRKDTAVKRLWNLDLLRVLAISAVVVIHTTQIMSKLDVHSYDWAVLNIYDSLARWAVPVFVMISGVLFLDPRKEQTLTKLYSKNVARIVTIILFWGFVYAIINHPPTDLSPNSLYAFFRTAVLGHYHMWFLYMIAGLYILVPVLRCIAASPKTLDYFLAVAFALNTLIPFLTSFGRLSLPTKLTESMLFQMPLGYSFYFLLGYWLSQRSFTKWQEKVLYLLGIVGLLATILLTCAASTAAGKSVFTYYGNFSLPVCLTSVALFVFSKRWPISPDTRHPVLALLSKSTLGVYLVHVIVLDGLQKIGLSAVAFNSALAVPATAFTAIVLSFALAVVMTKVPFFNRHFV